MRTVTCDFDACHTWETTSSVAKYCQECRCKRRAENASKSITLFEQPLAFSTTEINDLPNGYKVVVINDLQIPFQDYETLLPVLKFMDDFKADLEIYNGDIFDFYSVSQYDKNPSRLKNLQKELDECRSFLDDRATYNPGARKILMEGNHEDRLRRWLWRYGPELNSLRAMSLDSLLGLEEMSIERVNYRSVLDLLGFRIEHGYKTTGSAAYPVNVSRWMATATGSSGLCGHTHRFSVYSWTDTRGSHSYVENGCLCRTDLEYAPFPNWQQAFTYGVVQEGKLHVFPTQIYPSGFMAGGEFYPRRDN